MSLSLLLPFLAGAVYAAGALQIKRATDLGVGVWRTAFVANMVGAVAFQPLLVLGGEVRLDLWWQPILVGVTYVFGQWMTFLSIDRGDVSVATPVLGLKILLVAVLVTTFTGASLGAQLWIAALLATFAIVLLNQRPARATHHHVGRTIVTASLAALSFAICDVLVQRWSPAWGLGRFLPLTMMVSAVMSLVFVPLFRAPLSAIPPLAWRWLLGGAATLAVQSVCFVGGVAHWGNAAAANVVYSSRGLWSVVLVWLVGHWVTSREQHLEPRVLRARLAGAALMMTAIVIVVA